MKKIMSFLGCALFVAAMTVSCNSNTENTDSVVDTLATEEPVAEEVATPAEEAAPVAEANADDDAAILAAAKEAGQAICNCANGDQSSVEKCFNKIVDSYDYKDNQKFKDAVRAEIKNCVMDKAVEKGKEIAKKKGAELIKKAF